VTAASRLAPAIKNVLQERKSDPETLQQAEARPMNPLNQNDTALQSAQAWSERLGRMAAEQTAVRPEAASGQLNTTASTRLSAILSTGFAE
jgi:hypothetical protein